jgi:hypothetical protein
MRMNRNIAGPSFRNVGDRIKCGCVLRQPAAGTYLERNVTTHPSLVDTPTLFLGMQSPHLKEIPGGGALLPFQQQQ